MIHSPAAHSALASTRQSGVVWSLPVGFSSSLLSFTNVFCYGFSHSPTISFEKTKTPTRSLPVLFQTHQALSRSLFTSSWLLHWIKFLLFLHNQLHQPSMIGHLELFPYVISVPARWGFSPWSIVLSLKSFKNTYLYVWLCDAHYCKPLYIWEESNFKEVN